MKDSACSFGTRIISLMIDLTCGNRNTYKGAKNRYGGFSWHFFHTFLWGFVALLFHFVSLLSLSTLEHLKRWLQPDKVAINTEEVQYLIPPESQPEKQETEEEPPAAEQWDTHQPCHRAVSCPNPDEVVSSGSNNRGAKVPIISHLKNKKNNQHTKKPSSGPPEIVTGICYGQEWNACDTAYAELKSYFDLLPACSSLIIPVWTWIVCNSSEDILKKKLFRSIRKHNGLE